MSDRTFTERQLLALQNPTDRSEGQVIRPHQTATRRHGKWSTILEAGKLPKYGWLWMASVSRQRGPGRNPYEVGGWKAEWFPEADRILADLLQGVGMQPLDLAAIMGGNFDKQLAGYHGWRTMTPAEQQRLGPPPETAESVIGADAATNTPQQVVESGDRWRRPLTTKHAHFICAGNISLMDPMLISDLRDGDTASASHTDPDKPFLWRAKLQEGSVEWVLVGPSTKDRLRTHVADVDQVVVIAGPILGSKGSAE